MSISTSEVWLRNRCGLCARALLSSHEPCFSRVYEQTPHLLLSLRFDLDCYCYLCRGPMQKVICVAIFSLACVNSARAQLPTLISTTPRSAPTPAPAAGISQGEFSSNTTNSLGYLCSSSNGILTALQRIASNQNSAGLQVSLTGYTDPTSLSQIATVRYSEPMSGSCCDPSLPVQTYSYFYLFIMTLCSPLTAYMRQCHGEIPVCPAYEYIDIHICKAYTFLRS